MRCSSSASRRSIWLSATALRYQQGVAFVHSPPAGTQVLELAPTRALQTKRTTQDLRCLQADYAQGRELALRQRDRLQALLD